MIIKIENLTFSYPSFAGPGRRVLDSISLEIAPGELVAIVGPSGSGKTTLMQHFTGLLKPDSGRVLVDGQDIWAKGLDRTALRSRIGLVFQFPESQLFEETVYAEVAFGPKNMGLLPDEIGRRVRAALKQVELDFERFKDRSPFHLSAGETRRVAIASVLSMQPECLILDEPTAGMDFFGRRSVTGVLKRFHALGKTVVVISHNLDWVFALADRIVVIQDGRIAFNGKKGPLLENAEILRKAGLSLPRISPVLQRLRTLGYLKSNDVYSLEDISRALQFDSLKND